MVDRAEGKCRKTACTIRAKTIHLQYVYSQKFLESRKTGSSVVKSLSAAFNFIDLKWLAVCAVVLAGLLPTECARSKLPSWRGPDTFLDGNLPSSRATQGFMSSDDGRIYVFGGQTGELMRTNDGEAMIPCSAVCHSDN